MGHCIVSLLLFRSITLKYCFNILKDHLNSNLKINLKDITSYKPLTDFKKVFDYNLAKQFSIILLIMAFTIFFNAGLNKRLIFK